MFVKGHTPCTLRRGYGFITSFSYALDLMKVISICLGKMQKAVAIVGLLCLTGKIIYT
jgi:hypothetical protein